MKGYDIDPQGHPDIEQSKYAQSYVKVFQQYRKYLSLSLCLPATGRFSLGVLAQVHGHMGGFPSDGETVMNLIPLCRSTTADPQGCSKMFGFLVVLEPCCKNGSG